MAATGAPTRSGSAVPARALHQSGFTYLGLMFAVAVLGITLATVGIVWSTQIRREREEQLLWVGQQYRSAIDHYRAYGGQFPLALTDLLQDPRVPLPRRFLRQLYPDPMTGKADWQLVLLPSGSGIVGVASSSQEKPIKQANFDAADAQFVGAQCYCDWKFVFSPRYRWGTISVPAASPQQP
ncbi:MAG: type II secretion system protein [Gammaproteobacteria bacterium]|nr:type II secretion system protein [Gammaproteobacteria bacterium]